MKTERTLYAYLNIDHPMVAWEVAIGRICSNGALTGESFGISVWFSSLLRKLSIHGAKREILNEFSLESFRQRNFPEKASRLKGVYFFESEDMAHAALERWNLAKYRKYISPIHFYGHNYSHYDAEWISSCMNSAHDDWYANYLSGETYGTRPLTEVVAEGLGLILNNELRSQAAMTVINNWPTSSLLLASAICAAYKLNLWDVALSTPYIYSQDEKIGVHHCIKLDTLQTRQKDIAAALQECYSEKVIDLPIITPNSPDSIFSVPDLRSIEFLLDIPDAMTAFKHIHQG